MRSRRFLPSWKNIIRFLRDPESDWKPKLLLVIAIAYLVIPLDALPDLAPIIGWLDDLGLAGAATWYLVSASKSYEKRDR